MRKQLFNLVLIFILTLTAKISFAQETTATLGGNVADEKGSAVTGATITIRHEPTGTVSYTQTNSKGIFVMPNLKVGGPYTINVTYVGFATDTLQDVSLVLGDNPDLNIDLKPLTNTLTEVTVAATGRRSVGSGIIVGRQQLNTLPTIGRSLQDFTRLTPQSNNNSFAGTSFRYNNITLDGAINNDAIGFSNSFGGVSGGGQAGTAGSGTRTNPYSLDVIQEVQVQLSPYDVKLGNFTGGSVNAVTKSGSNDFHGSVYGYGRNASLVGKSVDGLNTKMSSDFHDYQTGATISGPIIKNKLFFIGNFELTRHQEPTFYNAGEPGAAINIADAESIINFLKTNYNYDPGTYTPYKIFTNSNKYFGRIDWTINSNSTLTLRGIYTNGWGNNLERTSTNFQFSSTDFTQYTKNTNIVAELKTKYSNSVSNQAIVSYINVHDYRTFPGQLSPFMDIGGGKIWAGTWREASVYNQKQKTFEFTDNVTWSKGINKFTFGTHNEFYSLDYGFINSWNGRWEYADLTHFLNSQPSRVRGAYTYDETKNNRDDLFGSVPGEHYNVNLMSAYVQDEIAASHKLKLSPGLRIDYPFLSKKIPLDQNIDTTHNYVSSDPTFSHTPWNEFTNKWLGKPTFSPRIGFTFDVNGNRSLILRGGTGIFVGRMPFAWIGYASTLSGNNFGNIDYKPSSGTYVPLAFNPSNLSDTLAAHGGSSATTTHEVDLIDNNFKLPTIWRSNIATDIRFGTGYTLTLDAMYTKTLYDVQFQQINIKDSAAYFTSGPTQTPVYVGGKQNSVFSNVYLLTNTKKGWRYNLTAQLNKTSSNIRMGNDNTLNLNWSVAYTYGMSKDLSNGIRNSFQSNYEVNPAISPNNPDLSYSNFDLRHRIVATTGFAFNWGLYNTTNLSFFYSGQSGSPFTYIYASSPNPFGNSSNANLAYIPASGEQINFSDIKDASGNVTYSAVQQQADFNNVVNNDSYLNSRKGQYTERNGAHTPWNHELDMKLMHEFRFKGKNKAQSLQFSVDVFNVLNLLNNDWGHINFVTNVNNYTVNLLKFATDANGKAPGAPSTGYVPTYNFIPPSSTGHYYTTDPINSRWQAQVGLKYNF